MIRRLATPALQPFWERTLEASLRGLNIGYGGHPDSSGELFPLTTLPRNATVFDVGANQGQYASAALRQRPDLQMYCFEPSPTAFEYLRGLPVQAFPFGFGETDEVVPLYSDTSGSEMTSLYPRQVEGKTFSQTEEGIIRTIDGFCQEQGIDRINLLKLDAEGHELSVLRGARATRADRIQFEFGGCNIDSRVFLRDFFELLTDYTIYRLLPLGLARVRYRERWEQFTTTNFLAVHHLPTN